MFLAFTPFNSFSSIFFQFCILQGLSVYIFGCGFLFQLLYNGLLIIPKSCKILDNNFHPEYFQEYYVNHFIFGGHIFVEPLYIHIFPFYVFFLYFKVIPPKRHLRIEDSEREKKVLPNLSWVKFKLTINFVYIYYAFSSPSIKWPLVHIMNLHDYCTGDFMKKVTQLPVCTRDR